MSARLQEGWWGWHGAGSLRLLVRSMTRRNPPARAAFAIVAALAVMLVSAI